MPSLEYRMAAILRIATLLVGQALIVNARGELQELAKVSNEFGLKIFRHMTRLPTEKKRNIVFSPIGIASALAMVHAGANADTRTQMEDVLDIGESTGIPNQAFGDLYEALKDPKHSITLAFANRLFVSQEFELLPDYVNIIEDGFHSEVERMNFNTKAADASRQDINNWVRNVTEQNNWTLLPRFSINGETSLVLANAAYFKATWDQFPAETTEGDFFLYADLVTTMSMMNISGARLNYAKLSALDAELIELPLTGAHISVYILLPTEKEGLEALERKLDHSKLQEAIHAKRNTEIDIVVPKFNLSRQVKIKPILEELGMSDLFSRADADLSRMTESSGNLVLNKVFNRALVEFNDADPANVSLAERSPVVSLSVDHPFVFFIRENSSGCILFLGHFVAPPIPKSPYRGTGGSTTINPRRAPGGSTSTNQGSGPGFTKLFALFQLIAVFWQYVGWEMLV